jgi:3-hydroxyisobutyrate dehydrogenase-like beta-hydroxyacid dehydrogenase
MTEPVTVLGLGPMGYAIAAAFATAGHATTTWNRTASRPSPDDTIRAEDVTEAVTASKIVVVCLIDYDAVRSLLTPLADTLRGRLVVNVTSGSPDAARELAAWAAEHDIAYTDGAIMTPTMTIGTPAAVVLHSGHSTDALAALGGRQTYLGAEPGRAAAFDVALLDLFWTSTMTATSRTSSPRPRAWHTSSRAPRHAGSTRVS